MGTEGAPCHHTSRGRPAGPRRDRNALARETERGTQSEKDDLHDAPRDVRAGTRLDSLVHGAGHEGGRRAGTENTPYIAALGRAASLCAAALPTEVERLSRLRDRLHERLAEAVPGLALNGHPRERLPNTLNVSFPGVDGGELLAATPRVAASTGSACHEGQTDPSPVLVAMGVPRERALGAVRLTLGRWSTEAEVDAAAESLAKSWRRRIG